MSQAQPRILIAGIGGASLGTEICKCLQLSGGYHVFGCDISPFAFGHYGGGFESTSIVGRDSYLDDVISLCEKLSIDCIIPGGDEPARLLAMGHERFGSAGVHIAANDFEIVANMSDKPLCFRILGDLGFTIPATRNIASPEDLDEFPMPCIVKPATGSGGSVFVFYAKDRNEAALYCSFLSNNDQVPMVQEYLSEERGEYTVMVLSLPDKRCAGSMALKRMFNSKLSVSAKGRGFLISSGYSQGEIAAFPGICSTAEQIATKLGSTGPLSIQGRLNSTGELIPFEINPRFSGSTYLRALAGFNEVDYYLRSVLGHALPNALDLHPGLYLRSLSEVAIPADRLRT